jgi:2-polyprenyl-3-methyl-5-hydroxy-6-metoxy-1,4-benzoquinol methylase
VRYDEARAASYDRLHGRRFEEVPVAVAVLADLHREAAAGDGSGAPALELGVGTGRLALPLAAEGVEVWGIDASEPMLERLRAKPGADAVKVVVGDFGDISALVDGPFSLVFVAFNTLFELDDQDAQVRCLQAVSERLTPGGMLLVEALAPDLTRLDQTLHALSAEADEVVLQATRHDPVAQRVTGADITVTAEGVRLSPWTIRYASVPELDLMARLAGLRLRYRWGGWHREPFTAASTTHVSVYEPDRT